LTETNTAGREPRDQMLDGNRAAAIGAKLCRVQVVAAYPITPRRRLQKHYPNSSRGESSRPSTSPWRVNTAPRCMQFSFAGGSQDFHGHQRARLAYMHEMLHWVAGTRLPVVLACVNRAIGAPWNVLNDQQDPYRNATRMDTGLCPEQPGDTGFGNTGIQDRREDLSPGHGLLRRLHPVPHRDACRGPFSGGCGQVSASLQATHHPGPGQSRNYNLVTLANPRINAEGVLCHGYMEIRYLLQEALQESREAISAAGRSSAISLAGAMPSFCGNTGCRMPR